MATVADSAADLVTQRSLVSAAVFHDMLHEAMGLRLEPLWDEGEAAVLGEVRVLLENAVPLLARLLADSSVASWLLGAAEVLALLPGDVEIGTTRVPLPAGEGAGPPGEPPVATGAGDYDWDWRGYRVWNPIIEGAVKDLRTRRVVTRDEWDTLNATARQKAFTVAYARSAESVEPIRQATAEAVALGEGFPAFKRNVETRLGTSPVGVGLLENCFRTNVATGYMTGLDRIASTPIMQELFPYRERRIVDDSRITDLCATLARSGLNGTALMRADDPAWRHFRPISHWQCRCGVTLLSVAEAAAKGVREAQEWLRTGIPPTQPEWVPWPNVELPEGWEPPTEI